MKSLIKSFIFAILFSSVAQAAVWETTQEWNQSGKTNFQNGLSTTLLGQFSTLADIELKQIVRMQFTL